MKTIKKEIKVKFICEEVNEFFEIENLLYSKLDFIFNHSNKRNYYLFKNENDYSEFYFEYKGETLTCKLSENGGIEILDCIYDVFGENTKINENKIIDEIFEKYELKEINAKGYSQNEWDDFYFLVKKENLKIQEFQDLFDDLDLLKSYFTRSLFFPLIIKIEKIKDKNGKIWINEEDISSDGCFEENEGYFTGEREKEIQIDIKAQLKEYLDNGFSLNFDFENFIYD